MPPPTRVFLVRHGETEWNRLGLYQGTTDVPLNPAGQAQAQELAGRLRRVGWTAAYTSPLRRAHQTAAAILRGTPCTAVWAPELREICYGRWQGRTIGIEGYRAPLEHRWRADPWSVRFPGGEGLRDLERRAGAAWDRIVAAHPGGTILLCGHGHLNRVLLIRAARFPRDQFWELPQDNCACQVIEYGEIGAAATVSAYVG